MIDYMIMEAVALRVQKQDADNEKAAKRKEWQNDMSALEDLR